MRTKAPTPLAAEEASVIVVSLHVCADACAPQCSGGAGTAARSGFHPAAAGTQGPRINRPDWPEDAGERWGAGLHTTVNTMCASQQCVAAYSSSMMQKAEILTCWQPATAVMPVLDSSCWMLMLCTTRCMMHLHQKP